MQETALRLAQRRLCPISCIRRARRVFSPAGPRTEANVELGGRRSRHGVVIGRLLTHWRKVRTGSFGPASSGYFGTKRRPSALPRRGGTFPARKVGERFVLPESEGGPEYRVAFARCPSSGQCLFRQKQDRHVRERANDRAEQCYRESNPEKHAEISPIGGPEVGGSEPAGCWKTQVGRATRRCRVSECAPHAPNRMLRSAAELSESYLPINVSRPPP